MKSMWRAKSFHIGGLLSFLYGFVLCLPILIDTAMDIHEQFGGIQLIFDLPALIATGLVFKIIEIFTGISADGTAGSYGFIPVLLLMNYLLGGYFGYSINRLWGKKTRNKQIVPANESADAP